MKYKRQKSKKQFRLYDIYRYAATGQMSEITGILSYECNDDATTIAINFEDYTGEFPRGVQRMYFSSNEYELKQIVKEVNQRLGNCLKPGRRKWRNK